jgi:hypothetical protein
MLTIETSIEYTCDGDSDNSSIKQFTHEYLTEH